MRESKVYQAILDEGRVEGALGMLLSLGEEKFGEPNEATRSTLKAIDDLERLDRLNKRVLYVATWQELLQTP